jgi:hypothetical protein
MVKAALEKLIFWLLPEKAKVFIMYLRVKEYGIIE